MRWKSAPKPPKPPKPCGWQSWFAWRPVKTVDFEWVWLERVERCQYMERHIPSKVPFSYPGGWVYRRAGSTLYQVQ